MSAANRLRLAVAGQSLIRHDPFATDNPEAQAVADIIQGCDAAFTNFEGCIAGRFGGWPTKDKAAHGVSPALLGALVRFGFTHLSLANNHAGDLGPNGILSTLAETAARGFTTAGTGPTLTAATAAASGRGVALVAMDAGPWDASVYASDGKQGRGSRPGVNRLRVERRLAVPPALLAEMTAYAETVGHAQRLATRVAVGFQSPAPAGCVDFFGLPLYPAETAAETWHVAPDDLVRQETAIAAAKASGDLVIASLHTHHWPADWQTPGPWVRSVAERLLAAGADVFLGHGAPVLQTAALIGGKPAFFGLGNFLFHSQRASVRPHPEIWRSLLACLTFENRYLIRIDVYALRLGGGTEPTTADFPRRWTGPEATAFLQAWGSGLDLSPTATLQYCDGVMTIHLPPGAADRPRGKPDTAPDRHHATRG